MLAIYMPIYITYICVLNCITYVPQKVGGWMDAFYKEKCNSYKKFVKSYYKNTKWFETSNLSLRKEKKVIRHSTI